MGSLRFSAALWNCNHELSTSLQFSQDFYFHFGFLPRIVIKPSFQMIFQGSLVLHNVGVHTGVGSISFMQRRIPDMNYYWNSWKTSLYQSPK